jgi:enoyl-CoA hydratase
MADIEFSTTTTDRVAEVTLALNKVNALSIEAVLALADHVETLGRTPEVSVIVIGNSGDSFCAGANVKELTADPSLIGASNRAWLKLVAACHRCEVPVIAAVDGHCIGGGIALAASCDIILLSDRSTFSLPQVKTGGWGAGTFLMRLLGPIKIRAPMLTGRTLTATDIAAGGQIEAVLPREQLRSRALELARDIALNSPEAIRAGKAALNGIEHILNLVESYRFEHAFTTELFVSPEAAGRRAAVFGSQS